LLRADLQIANNTFLAERITKIAERRRAIARNARMKAITGALRLIMSVLAKLAVSSYALPYRGVAST